MDQAHKEILQKHRVRVVENLNVDRVKDSLIKDGIFDSGQWEEIATAGKGTREEKASALMDELPRRGPTAFRSFCEALVTRGYKFLGEPLIKEGADSRTDEEVEREALSPDTGEQDDATSVDELGESGYVEGEGLQEHDEASGGISHEEERITIKDMKRLFSAQEEKNDRKLDQKIDQLSEKLGQNIDRKLDQKIDQLSNELDQRLSRQNEAIKASLFDISSHLIDIKQALGGQTEMMTQVSNLEKRVRNLLVQQIDRTTIMGEIKDIESEVVELKENFKGGDDKIQYDLTEMNKHLHDMRMMLERDSKNQKQLSVAIGILKTELPSVKFKEFAQALGFSDPEITEIRSSGPGYITQQRSELFRRWRTRKGTEATVKTLAQACRDTGLSTLADRISGIAGAPSGAHAGPLPPIQEPQGTRLQPSRQTWPSDSKGCQHLSWFLFK
ncbi:uncharacterized protein [Branchiostoma lanceolatum]|uniref:uncharacterized protein n=1 Tax=Branchiostoma lanceolatum TaxID=7740 RepID=UPI003454B9F6